MPLLDSLIIWAHLLATSIWVGGSIFIGIVIGPLLKILNEKVEERTMIMIKIGRRFNKIAVPALGILIVTGLYNARYFISSPNFATPYGIILSLKVILVISMIAVFLLHVKIFGSKFENDLNVGKELHRSRGRVILLGRIIVGQSIAILLLAALLDSGIE